MTHAHRAGRPESAAASEDRYRDQIRYDRATYGTHCANCIANCSYRVYVSGSGAAGRVLWEEPTGTFPAIEPGVPDMNPMGCQKGAAWSHQIANGDRITHPMRRVGERGSGRWERISWDEALAEVADAIIDAVEEQGPGSIIVDEGTEGGLLTFVAKAVFAEGMGASFLDSNPIISDCHIGQYAVFGNIFGGSSADDTFYSDLILVWHANPSYTRIPYYHYLTEARYRGAELVVISPDYSPSSIHADYHVPVRPGTDAALALAICQVLIDEDLVDREFALEQTDLGLLVRREDGRFLRASDIEEGGRQDRFCHWSDGRPVVARLGSLDLEYPAELDATGSAALGDGSEAEVATVFALLREELAAYTPEKASEICGVGAGVIRRLARKAAAGRTKLYEGLDTPKHHHGDLMERAMLLVLALTGNWGKKGTGLDTYVLGASEGQAALQLKREPGAAATDQAVGMLDAMINGMRAADPEKPAAACLMEILSTMARTGTGTSPPFFFWYHQAGFAEMWNRAGYSDSPRPFDEYFAEAEKAGWWAGMERPGRDVKPRVYVVCGTNPLRRTRGGQRQYLKHVWPGLTKAVLIDYRFNTAGMLADIVLPAAAEAERLDLQAIISRSFEMMLSDKAVEPAGEARTDRQIFIALAKTVAERAAARGLESFTAAGGLTKTFSDAYDRLTLGGKIVGDEEVLDEAIRDMSLLGVLPPGFTLERMRAKGWERPTSTGPIMGRFFGGEIEPDQVFVAYQAHVLDKLPYVTLTGRAQFYIDHPWFLEAGEALPVHKEPPRVGGDFPLQLTGGHPRWSIHANNVTSQLMLETTRGHPVVHLNPGDAVARDIADGDEVRVFNEIGATLVGAKLSPAVRPGQAILYASWEPFVFRGWEDGTFLEAGMVKWLHMAGGYGHLTYTPFQWQPVFSDRLTRVDVEKAPGR